jgi:uncharacterized protein (DUF169 family)
MFNLKDAGERVEKILRLKTYIVGLQFFETLEDMERMKKLRRLESKRVFCQIITVARTYGWSMGVTPDDLIHNSFCNAMLGFYDKPGFTSDGRYKGSIWFESKEDAQKYEQSLPAIPSGKFHAVAISPIFSARLDPDLVLIYGNPAQLMLFISGLQWKNYERLTFYCVAESSCADAIAQSYLSKKPCLTIPCFGERRFGHAQDDELVMAMPPASLIKAAEGLVKLGERGMRYPIPFFGVQVDPNEGMPDIFKYYHSLK